MTDSNMETVIENADSDVSEVEYSAGDESQAMPERVQFLARSTYKELERLIELHGQDVVKQLMPLICNVFEDLQSSFLDRQAKDAELELVRDDKEQLLTQYEREKEQRKIAEMRYLELEDTFEENKKEQHDEVERMQSIIRLLDLKMKNAQDQVSRLEERDAETKKEFTKLHERYTELFKAHMDYKERAKFGMSVERPVDGSATLPKRLPSHLSPAPVRQISTPAHVAEVLQKPYEGPALPFTPLSCRHEGFSVQQELKNVGRIEEFGGDRVTYGKSETVRMDQETRGTNTANVVIVTEDQSTETGDLKYFQSPECEGVDEHGLAVKTAMESVNDEHNSLSIYDEVSARDSEALGQIDDGADIAGMSREVENLIQENNELLETKNALNIVKDDLIAKLDQLSSEYDILSEGNKALEASREKLKIRISELEEEVRKIREDLEQEKMHSEAKRNEEDDIPTAQRKRFTRVEMARVLMERNQYKERLMELQEAVRWAEMLRAAREHPDPPVNKKKSAIWSFFSNLFSQNKSTSPRNSAATIHYQSNDSPTDNIFQINSGRRSAPTRIAKSVRFREEDIAADEARKQRKEERKNTKSLSPGTDDSCLQANGWSLPAKFYPEGNAAAHRMSVPIPVYCRPIADDPGVQLFCSAAVNINGWKPSEARCRPSAAGPQLEDDIRVDDVVSSSYIWICTTTHNGTHVSVADVNNLSVVIDKFRVSSSHILCMTGVPGASETDFPCNVDSILSNAGSSDSSTATPSMVNGLRQHFQHVSLVKYTDVAPFNAHDEDSELAGTETGSTIITNPSGSSVNGSSPILSTNGCHAELDGLHSELPTMWLGAQSGRIYVHSAVHNWKHCLCTIRLMDAIVDITHIKGRVLAALANGTIVVFRRMPDEQWDFTSYFVVTIGEPYIAVRSLCFVATDQVWCGYQNKVYVLNAEYLSIERSFDAHPRRESQVRQMAHVGEGVWISIRLDSTLRLYHAISCQHLQDIDVEPHVNKLSGNLGFSFVRISCLLISCNRLWIGTGNGVIVSIPLFETSDIGILTAVSACDSNRQTVTPPTIGRPGGVVRVYGDGTGYGSSTDRLIPYCNISQAQLSYHGHKDAVKFFVAVPGLPVPGSSSPEVPESEDSRPAEVCDKEPESLPKNIVLVIAGGEGYVDFRRADSDEEAPAESEPSSSSVSGKLERGHLIAWQVYSS